MTRRTILKAIVAAPAAIGVAATVADKKYLYDLCYDGTTGEFQWVLVVDPSTKVVRGVRIEVGDRLSECPFTADQIKITHE